MGDGGALLKHTIHNPCIRSDEGQKLRAMNSTLRTIHLRNIFMLLDGNETLANEGVCPAKVQF